MKARENKRHSVVTKVRQFVVPTINFEAASYFELVEWKEVTEPPVTFSVSSEELQKLVQTWEVLEFLP